MPDRTELGCALVFGTRFGADKTGPRRIARSDVFRDVTREASAWLDRATRGQIWHSSPIVGTVESK